MRGSDKLSRFWTPPRYDPARTIKLSKGRSLRLVEVHPAATRGYDLAVVRMPGAGKGTLMQEEDEGSVAAERTEELLEASSSSVAAELGQARAWLKSLHLPYEPERWRIDAAAGADGAMANAWGRLTLWSRADGIGRRVQSDLDAAMDSLVSVRQCLVRGTPGAAEEERLVECLDRLERVHAALRGEPR